LVFLSDFVRYNRVLFVITGKKYQKNDLNQPNKYSHFPAQSIVYNEQIPNRFSKEQACTLLA
jgi:hypothetical protein